MSRTTGVVALIAAVSVSHAIAQAGKPAGPKSVMNEITVTADAVYTGTMEMAVDAGKVTGTLHITKPTEITGTVAGTAKAGVLTLEFPYRMVERACDGVVKMKITLPPVPGPATGTMEAAGCGRAANDALAGTLELRPVALKKK